MDWIPTPSTLLTTVNDTNVYGEDVYSFLPGQWLNDNAITFAIEYLYSHLSEDRKDRVHIVHASLCEILKLCQDDSEIPMFFEGVNMKEKEMVLFVVNDNDDASRALGGSHWSLLVWLRDQAKFIFFDSIPNRKQEKSLYWARTIGSRASCLLLLDSHSSTPPFTIGKCPVQTNGSDCGMHVIETARLLLKEGYPEELKFGVESLEQRRLDWIEIAHNLYCTGED